MMLRALTAASILALTIAAAQAAPVMDVTFSDLNLSNPSDVRILEARIHQAANKACAPLLQTSFTSLDYRIWFSASMRATTAETTRWVEARTGQYRSFSKN